MKKILTTLIITASLWTGTAVAHNHDTPTANTVHKIGDIHVSDAYIKDTKTTDRPSVAYFTVKNTGKTDDTLLSVSSDIAKTVQIHETNIDSNGVMSMNYLHKGVKVPAGKSVELKPRGLHLMLMDLTKPLKAGDTATLKLTFEYAGVQTLNVPIKPSNIHHCPKACKHCKTHKDCKDCKHCQGKDKKEITAKTAEPQQCHH